MNTHQRQNYRALSISVVSFGTRQAISHPHHEIKPFSMPNAWNHPALMAAAVPAYPEEFIITRSMAVNCSSDSSDDVVYKIPAAAGDDDDDSPAAHTPSLRPSSIAHQHRIEKTLHRSLPRVVLKQSQQPCRGHRGVYSHLRISGTTFSRLLVLTVRFSGICPTGNTVSCECLTFYTSRGLFLHRLLFPFALGLNIISIDNAMPMGMQVRHVYSRWVI
jgi:hypothetical protein